MISRLRQYKKPFVWLSVWSIFAQMLFVCCATAMAASSQSVADIDAVNVVSMPTQQPACHSESTAEPAESDYPVALGGHCDQADNACCEDQQLALLDKQRLLSTVDDQLDFDMLASEQQTQKRLNNQVKIATFNTDQKPYHSTPYYLAYCTFLE